MIRHINMKVQSVQSAVTESQQQVNNIQTQTQQQQVEQLNLKMLKLEVPIIDMRFILLTI